MDWFRLYTVAETLAPVRASGGMRIVPDHALATAPEPKVIVIPAHSDPNNHRFCAVCGMDVDAVNGPKSVYQGKTYYFCSADHKINSMRLLRNFWELHNAGARAPRSFAPTEPPACGSMAGLVVRELGQHPRARQCGAAFAAPGGRLLLTARPLLPASDASAVHRATLSIGPVLVGSTRFAPFP
jgi:hypothetical protein